MRVPVASRVEASRLARRWERDFRAARCRFARSARAPRLFRDAAYHAAIDGDISAARQFSQERSRIFADYLLHFAALAPGAA